MVFTEGTLYGGLSKLLASGAELNQFLAGNNSIQLSPLQKTRIMANPLFVVLLPR